ncbi:MAG: class I SAM-dependent methyltransferase [Sneathiella sp.]|nr:class I SAM-dependent methyltransferase [Sneathiella sp.]
MRRPDFIARQGRRPSGLFGYIVAFIMASETEPENVQTLKFLEIQPNDRILEVGCGHGATLRSAAKQCANLSVTGIDFSDVMVNVARRRNRKFITSGHMKIHKGDSANLPYLNDGFNKIYSVHTIYFWQNPEIHLQEIRRVLTPGGQFVLGFRSGDDTAFVEKFPASIYNLRTAAKVDSLLRKCDFRQVMLQKKCISGHTMYWITASKAPTEGEAHV